MTSAQAILTGAVLIAASIFFVNSINPAAAQRLATGPFQLMHHSNTTAQTSIFRLDTSSGEVTYCYVVQNPNTDLVCTRSVK